jgi:anti-sigma B factor antagonist
MDEFKVESLPGVRNDVRILRLSGPFTVRGIFDFRASVLSGNDPVTLIDLTGVPYMDSTALGEIIKLHTSSLRQQRQYALVGASERLRTLFKIVGVHQILIMHPTLKEAEQKLSSNAARN